MKWLTLWWWRLFFVCSVALMGAHLVEHQAGSFLIDAAFALFAWAKLDNVSRAVEGKQEP